MNDSDKNCKLNIARFLLLGSGVVFVAVAVLYNEFLLTFIFTKLPLEPWTIKRVSSIQTIEKIRSLQIYFLLISGVLIGLSELIRRISWFAVTMNKPLVTKILLIFLSICLPVSILELSISPFVVIAKTTIFIKDSELGWKLKPHSEDTWGRVKVKINSKGLRGPELEYTKPADVSRILFIGDSVTFGNGLKSYEQTFPCLVEKKLQNKFTKKIETINAGVGGYSPWQEDIYLSKEGIKYDPDLVVVSFVLNDVTEKFYLTRFGGRNKGSQLNAVVSVLDRSGMVYLLRKLRAVMRFGTDVQKGAAEKEVEQIKQLISCSDCPEVKRKWAITLENLGKIFDFCKNKNIPVLLVVFPFAFQFEDIKANAIPQAILGKYANDNKIPMIDLLPMLSEKMNVEELKPRAYFLDHDHLSPRGSVVVAKIIADFIYNERLIHNK